MTTAREHTSRFLKPGCGKRFSQPQPSLVRLAPAPSSPVSGNKCPTGERATRPQTTCQWLPFDAPGFWPCEEGSANRLRKLPRKRKIGEQLQDPTRQKKTLPGAHKPWAPAPGGRCAWAEKSQAGQTLANRIGSLPLPTNAVGRLLQSVARQLPGQARACPPAAIRNTGSGFARRRAGWAEKILSASKRRAGCYPERLP